MPAESDDFTLPGVYFEILYLLPLPALATQTVKFIALFLLPSINPYIFAKNNNT